MRQDGWAGGPSVATRGGESELVLGLGGDLSGRRFLDAACGDGAYLVEAARQGAAATGVDPIDPLLAVARRRAADRGVAVDLLRAEATALPFEDETFDVAFMVTVLSSLGDPLRAVAEAARVLRPGGRLVIGEPGRSVLWREWQLRWGWMGEQQGRHPTFLSPRRLSTMLERAGLIGETRRGIDRHPPVAAAPSPSADSYSGRPTGVTCGAGFVAMAAVKPRD
ncbi:MAG: class I SAM-dependent methyltransferase [Actinomycetota bacterium]